MGKSCRHFKALMRKNCINWKRTPCGSLMEVCLPIALTLILVYARMEIQPEPVENYSLYSLRHPLYPVAKPDTGVEGNYTVNIADQFGQMQDYNEFMTYANYLNINTTIEVPVLGVFNTFNVGSAAEDAISDVAETVRDTYQNLTILQTFIEDTPITEIANVINWEAFQQFLNATGLLGVVNVTEVQSFVQDFTESIADSNQTLSDLIGLNITETLDQAADFQFEDVTVPLDIRQYVPVLDLTGPYLFYPEHCYGDASKFQYDSPIIGYIPTNSSIEQAVISSLESLFETQRSVAELGSAAALVSFFSANLGGLGNLGGFTIPGLADAQQEFSNIAGNYGLNATDFDSIDVTEFGSGQGKTDISPGNFTLQAFATQEELDEYMADPEYGIFGDKPAVCYAFRINEDEDKHKYELEMFFNDMWIPWYNAIPMQRKPAFDASEFLPQTDDYVDYSYKGFAYMQNWVANVILKEKTGNPDASILAMTVPMRIPDTFRDDFQYLIKGTLTFFIICMYIPPLYRTVYRIVAEKESRVRESMKMMGLGDFAYWSSWFCYYTIVNTVMAVLALVILDIWCLPRTETWVTGAAIWLFGQSLFGLIMFTQSLFVKARAAAITTSMVYFTSTLAQFFVRESAFPTKTAQYICNLSPTVALIQTFTCISEFETSRVGNRWDNIWTQHREFSVGEGLCFLAIDCLYIFLIGIYAEQVMPKTYGLKKGLCFCLTPRFWCPKGCCSSKAKKGVSSGDVEMTHTDYTPGDSRIHNHDSARDIDRIEETLKFETRVLNEKCYEKIQPDQAVRDSNQQVVRIEDLHKTYDNGFKAVNGLNLKMFQDQIFVLLGHNGAGKTSTISMLTGLFSATKGKAEVYGESIFDNIDEVRNFMGVCPQHDVLFELLTPKEHLELFYEFKGGVDNAKKKKQEIDKLLNDIGVADKKNAMAFQLSGGNKRKLSVAIALCGGSKFVLLDEPTSGLDLSARRQLWDMLKEYKRDRIVLLTTHYMDEADILGDRIGIMTSGQMTCLGSSLFLKNRFGVGYVMTLVKESPETNTQIISYLKDKLGPLVTKLTEIQSEMTVQIPTSYTSKFMEFFSDFDANYETMGIVSYGLSLTTLEQVFLEIGHLKDPSSKVKDEVSQDGPPAQGEIMPSDTTNVAGGQRGQDVSQTALNASGGAERGEVTASVIAPDADKTVNVLQPQDEKVVESGNNDQSSRAEVASNDNERGDNPADVNYDSNGHRSLKNSATASAECDNMIQVIDQPLDEDKPTPQTPDDDEENFSLAQSKLDQSFCYNFRSCMLKRFNNYRRNYKQLFSEVFLPAFFMIFGINLAHWDFTFRSPSLVYTPSSFPLPQKIYVNSEYVDPDGSNIALEDIINNIDGQDSFEFVYGDHPVDATVDDFTHFSEKVFDFGTTECAKQPYHYSSYEMYSANSDTQQYMFFNHVNITSEMVTGFFPQFMYEAILKTATGDPEFEFKTRSTAAQLTNEITYRVATSDAGTMVFFLGISFSILITVTISYVVVERITMLKHMQVISGMRLLSYWASNFIFDALKFYFTIGVSFLMMRYFEYEFDSAIVLLALFPFGILPFTYVMSFMFTVDSAAQTFTMFLHFAVMLIFGTLVYALRIAFELQHIGDQLNWYMRIIPSYSIPIAFYFETSGKQLSDLRKLKLGTGGPVDPDQWHWANNTADIIAMGVHFVFWFLILFLIEIDLGSRLKSCHTKCCMFLCCCRKMPPRSEVELDQDVVDEQKRVRETDMSELKIKVEDLRKVYMTGKGPCTPGKAFLAVESISFGLQAGECFALLGVNGAGKSTTFKSLTSEITPTEGKISISHYDITKDFNKIKKYIGYCPQTNPIFDHMTVWEHVDYFARIKGIPSDKRKKLVDRAIHQLGLDEYRDKFGGNLSGGNKRKLSVAIAIVGSPPIILLDEPSAGMDPEARRFMWQVVANISANKTSAVILTTHSMEEAEALCTKMGIMVKGGMFKCFGTPQHIKDKFGKGFVIEIKAEPPSTEQIQSFIEERVSEHIPDAKASSQISDPVDLLEKLGVLPLFWKAILKNKLVSADSTKVNDEVGLYDLCWDMFVQEILFAVIKDLCKEFGEVDVIEQYGNYTRLRVDRGSRQIGSLFRQVEELKLTHALQDYSVSQTTLEQIFQGFADLKFDENILKYKLNADEELVKV